MSGCNRARVRCIWRERGWPSPKIIIKPVHTQCFDEYDEECQQESAKQERLRVFVQRLGFEFLDVYNVTRYVPFLGGDGLHYAFSDPLQAPGYRTRGAVTHRITNLFLDALCGPLGVPDTVPMVVGDEDECWVHLRQQDPDDPNMTAGWHLVPFTATSRRWAKCQTRALALSVGSLWRVEAGMGGDVAEAPRTTCNVTVSGRCPNHPHLSDSSTTSFPHLQVLPLPHCDHYPCQARCYPYPPVTTIPTMLGSTPTSL